MVSSATPVIALISQFVLVLLGSAFCEAATSTSRSVSWSSSQSSVHPEDPEDITSFIFEGSELTRASSAGFAVSATSTGVAASAMSTGPETFAVSAASGEAQIARGTAESAPPEKAAVAQDTPASKASWEADFAAAVAESKKMIETEEWDVGSWAPGPGDSGVVPALMLHAETLLESSEAAPANLWKEKTAERALRMYYHAKWLAEKNYVRAAEYRYREAARLARSCRRSVLASHALARLGYFLMHWKRSDEAAGVLQESIKLNAKTNPLALYLHGILERKAAGNVGRLRDAEESILKAGEQPSEELELERSRLVHDISYWREAENSSRHCFASSDAAFVLICLCGHTVSFFQQLLFK